MDRLNEAGQLFARALMGRRKHPGWNATMRAGLLLARALLISRARNKRLRAEREYLAQELFDATGDYRWVEVRDDEREVFDA